MPGGGVVVQDDGRKYAGHLTRFVFISCIVAASGGLIFGYDIGISGGVTGMDDFLKKFFPKVYAHKQLAHEDDYCKFDNHILQFFTSSLYLAALIASFVASTISRKYGRISSIRIGAVSFLCGAILNGSAVNIAMLIIGRLLLGVGVGFANQSVPLYLSEMAPAHLRGSLNMMFQLAITLGILVAGIINYCMRTVSDGWKWSLGLAAVPALLMLTGSFFLPDTPNNLIERGHLDSGKRVLLRTRGVGLNEVEKEFEDIVAASLRSKNVEKPYKSILERKKRPHLVITLLIPFFQQFTGINAIMFYAPVLFQTIGFGSKSSLYSSIITGGVNFVATLVSIATVDRVGRRTLFMEGGTQMIISQLIVGIILACLFGGAKQLSHGVSVGVIIVICTYVAAFAWSWGPLGWLVPSEIFPMETRSVGQAINVSVNMLFTFIIAQAFLSMLCHFQYGIFFFFAGFVLIMTLFIYFFLPETSGVHIDDMDQVWRAHWFWKKYLPIEDQSNKQAHEAPKIVVE